MKALTLDEVEMVSGGLLAPGDDDSPVYRNSNIFNIQAGAITPSIPTRGPGVIGIIVTGISLASDLITVGTFAYQGGWGNAWDQFRSYTGNTTIFSSGGKVYFNGTDVTNLF